MMKKYAIVLFFSLLAGVGPPPHLLGASSAPDSGVTLTDQQLKSVIAQFEDSVLTLSKWLENCKTERKSLDDEIEKLKGKIGELRQATQNGSNVFDDIRLKGLLNDLKDKLEKNSALQHEWDEKQKEFEQKALSLISLYNDRIDSDLESTNPASEPSLLAFKLNEVAALVQKRNHAQFLLSQYQKKDEAQAALAEPSLGTLKTGDRESLALALDLIRDRKTDLEGQLEKWSIEEDEVRNELALHGKMQEFLDDIQRMNEDSNFPHGSLKRNDLGDMAGNKEKVRLETRLNELQGMVEKGQKTLGRLTELMTKIQNRLDSLPGGQGK